MTIYQMSATNYSKKSSVYLSFQEDQRKKECLASEPDPVAPRLATVCVCAGGREWGAYL